MSLNKEPADRAEPFAVEVNDKVTVVTEAGAFEAAPGRYLLLNDWLPQGLVLSEAKSLRFKDGSDHVVQAGQKIYIDIDSLLVDHVE